MMNAEVNYSSPIINEIKRNIAEICAVVETQVRHFDPEPGIIPPHGTPSGFSWGSQTVFKSNCRMRETGRG
jgi:hypothetical protein